MDNRLLYIGNIAGKRMTGSFSGTAIAAAHDLGMDVICVANRSEANEDDIKLDEKKWGVKLLHIDLTRSPYRFLQNYKAYKQLIKIIKDYDIKFIHCNTPVGGMLGRLAGRKCKVTKVIYQAHGFHFFKGAPKKNWLIYYTIENQLARITDALITINKEDYVLAKKNLKLREKGHIYYVHGVGIDTSQYSKDEEQRKEKRSELGLKSSDFALISMGDLIERKNYGTAIRAVAAVNEPSLHYYICGTGAEEERLKVLAQSLGVSEQVHFLGFRTDIKELLIATDAFLFTTKQEGLSRAMLEAMASGLPCIASKIRGNTDLLEGVEGGFLCETMDVSNYAEKIMLLKNDKAMREAMGENNRSTVQKFSTKTVREELKKIYESEFHNRNGDLRKICN